MRLNNKGLSLIELVIAISMSTIVVGAAVLFLYNAERSYRTAEYSVDVQMEAQILMEQMSNWVMNSNYIAVKDESTDASTLVLYQLPRTLKDMDFNDSAVLAKRIVIYMYDGKLYLYDDTESVAGEYLNEIKGTGFDLDDYLEDNDPDDSDCIGEYVNKFTVDLPYGVSSEKINAITVRLGMYEGVKGQSYSYSVKDQFSLRNGLYQMEEAEDDED